METNEQKLARLIMENPGLPVIPFVDGNAAYFDECRHFAMELGSSYVSEIATFGGKYDDGKVYDDRDEFIEDWIDANDDWLTEEYGNNETLIEKSAEEAADKAFEKVIIVNIDEWEN